jgi:hypothetical protein
MGENRGEERSIHEITTDRSFSYSVYGISGECRGKSGAKKPEG